MQLLVSDRHLLVVVALFILICLAVLILLALGIHPSERQVAVHYTSFGTTNFYRDKWLYLLSFVGFTLVMAVAHVLLTFKVLQEKGKDLAIAFAWLGIIVALVSAALFYQILKIASII